MLLPPFLSRDWPSPNNRSISFNQLHRPAQAWSDGLDAFYNELPALSGNGRLLLAFVIRADGNWRKRA
jgi:hypothetical protein